MLTEPEITEVGERRQELKSPLPVTLPSITAFSAFRLPLTEAFCPIVRLPFEVMLPLMEPSKMRSVEQLRSPSIWMSLDKWLLTVGSRLKLRFAKRPRRGTRLRRNSSVKVRMC